MNNKQCLKCLQLKELSMFYKDSRRKDGLFSYCKDCHNLICANYHRTDKFIKYQNKYTLNKYHTHEQFRLEKLVRARLRGAIKLNSTTGSVVKLLGCTIPEFKTYIEGKFKEGMTWKNLGLNGWHLDHIKPLSMYNLSNPLEYAEACHYTNIQPLWARENIQKGNKFQK